MNVLHKYLLKPNLYNELYTSVYYFECLLIANGLIIVRFKNNNNGKFTLLIIEKVVIHVAWNKIFQN